MLFNSHFKQHTKHTYDLHYIINNSQQRNGMNRNGNGGGGGGSQGGGDSNNSNYGYGYGVNHAQGGREEITFLVPASKCGVSFT